MISNNPFKEMVYDTKVLLRHLEFRLREAEHQDIIDKAVVYEGWGAARLLEEMVLPAIVDLLNTVEDDTRKGLIFNQL